jgi:hypothetical protein
MGRIAITSGGAGDVIISVPIMKLMGISTLYIKESYYPEGWGSMYTGLKELIELQGFRVLPTKDEGLGFDRFDPAISYDINMDAWRNCRGRGRDYIGLSMAKYWRVARRDHRAPWLTLDTIPTDLTGQDYTVWFLSPRWRFSDYDWKKGFESVKGNKIFIGFEQDWQAFCEEVGHIDYVFTKDFMEMVRIIRDCRALYCNQGPAVALAQGIGKDYYCAFKKQKTNVRLYTKWEHALL